MPFWPLTLIKRLVIGVKVRPDQEDQNFTDIENSVNELHSLFSVVLRPDGTLKDNSVSTASIQNRAVNNDKLSFEYCFYAVATGSGNAIAVSFDPLPALSMAAGILLQVKTIADSTAAVTLQLDNLAVLPVKVASATGLVDVPAGGIRAGGVYDFLFDGTQWILQNPTTTAAVSGPVFIPTLSIIPLGNAFTWADKDLSLSVPDGAKAVILNYRGYWNSGTDGAVTAQVRTDPGGLAYDLGETGGVDGTTNRCQIQALCSTARHIQIQVQTTVNGFGQVAVDLVGYVL